MSEEEELPEALTAEEALRMAEEEGLTLEAKPGSRTGYVCVSQPPGRNGKLRGKFFATARKDGKKVHLGSYKTAEEAALMVARAKHAASLQLQAKSESGEIGSPTPPNDQKPPKKKPGAKPPATPTKPGAKPPSAPKPRAPKPTKPHPPPPSLAPPSLAPPSLAPPPFSAFDSSQTPEASVEALRDALEAQTGVTEECDICLEECDPPIPDLIPMLKPPPPSPPPPSPPPPSPLPPSPLPPSPSNHPPPFPPYEEETEYCDEETRYVDESDWEWWKEGGDDGGQHEQGEAEVKLLTRPPANIPPPPLSLLSLAPFVLHATLMFFLSLYSLYSTLLYSLSLSLSLSLSTLYSLYSLALLSTLYSLYSLSLSLSLSL